MNDEQETKKPRMNFKVTDVIELSEKEAYDHKAEHIAKRKPTITRPNTFSGSI